MSQPSPVIDVLVIGAGFWGTAIAFEAQKVQFDVSLVDNQSLLAASRSSTAMVSEGWYSQKSIKQRLPERWNGQSIEYGLQWLQDNCGLLKTGEDFVNYRTPEVKKERSDLFVLENNEKLLGLFPSTRYEVSTLYRNNKGHWVAWSQGKEVVAKKVVIAAGYGTDTLLLASGLRTVGVSILEGQCAILESPMRLERPLTYLARPYVNYHIRPWEDGLCLGSVAKEKEIAGMLRVADRFLPAGYRVKEWKGGWRPVTEQFFVAETEPGLIVATGGHRVGLGLSGLVARDVVKLLKNGRLL